MDSDSRTGATGTSTPRALQKEEKPASEKLAEKLLLGWTMLGDICPQCATVPLMRDKQRQLFCVTCDTFLPKEEEQKDSSNSSSTDSRPQKETASNAAAIEEEEADGRVHYRLGGVMPLSAAAEKSEQPITTAAVAGAAAASTCHTQSRGRRAGASAGREKRKSGCTGGDSRKTESSEESDCGSSLAELKVSPELAAWRDIVRRRCWASSPPCSGPLSKISQGEERGEEVRQTKGKGEERLIESQSSGAAAAASAATRFSKNSRTTQRDTREEGDSRNEEEAEDILSGLRSSTMRKIQRYWAWLDASGCDYDAATVERDRQVFSALHAALQVLDDLRRFQ